VAGFLFARNKNGSAGEGLCCLFLKSLARAIHTTPHQYFLHPRCARPSREVSRDGAKTELSFNVKAYDLFFLRGVPIILAADLLPTITVSLVTPRRHSLRFKKRRTTSKPNTNRTRLNAVELGASFEMQRAVLFKRSRGKHRYGHRLHRSYD
jgi:hypothetical protein